MATSPDTIDVLDRLLEPVGRCLTPEVARKIVELRADPGLQVRIDELADKSTEGRLSEEERAQYEKIVCAIDFIAVLQAKARAVLNRSESP
ncbi:MAG TPA: hypothetical protein VMV10_16295 [Pirellulales bacterium]|nr:hypothetical protein [Pirellulales bacterium]